MDDLHADLDALGAPAQPSSSGHAALLPLAGGAVHLEGGFWGERQLRNREVTIPHGIEMLEEWGSLDNLRLAAGAAGPAGRSGKSGKSGKSGSSGMASS
jgi:hypothetical protein